MGNVEWIEKKESPTSGSKLKRAASSYSPRSGNSLLSSSPPDKKSLDALAPSKTDKNPTPADAKKPPVKPKPAHLSRRKLSDGAVQVPSSARLSQNYGTMPAVDQEAPAPPEGVVFSIPREDSGPRPPSNASPRLSLRRSPPSAPNVTTAPEKEKERERDKDKEKDKKKKGMSSVGSSHSRAYTTTQTRRGIRTRTMCRSLRRATFVISRTTSRPTHRH